MGFSWPVPLITLISGFADLLSRKSVNSGESIDFTELLVNQPNQW